MKTRITALDFGKCSYLLSIMYVIEIKEHWWSPWRIRDFDCCGIPRFYSSKEECVKHI